MAERQGFSWRRQLVAAARELAPAENAGEIYAVHFGNCLQTLVGEGVIDDWRETERNLAEDRQGVDFWVGVKGERFGFQITSKITEVRKKRRKHPDVYVIYLLDPETAELRTDGQLRGAVEGGIGWYKDKAAKGKAMFGYRRRG